VLQVEKHIRLVIAQLAHWIVAKVWVVEGELAQGGGAREIQQILK